LEETIDALAVEPGKKYIDATLGSGGHATAIVKRGGAVLGIDADPEAIAFAKEEFEKQNITKLKVALGNFRDLSAIAEREGYNNVDGILFDLGISSHQLDTPERGFSYRFAAAGLDLRLDQTKGESAAQLIARASQRELYEIIATYGEEELADRIAGRIVSARKLSPVASVGQLAEAIGTDTKRRSRVFQALRIAVNDEIGSLKAALVQAKALLVPGGRLVVISFHSLEDRIVKQFLRSGGWRLITTKPQVPRSSERVANPRARSAKLRAAVKQ
jgi:16S rRNA (cytosine1402-N4)-methyltransferase